MKKHEKQTEKNLFICCAAGVLYALLCAVIIISLVSALAMLSSDPLSKTPWGYAIYLICATLCGMIAGAKYGKSRILCGFLSGMVYTMAILCASVLTAGTELLWFMPLLSLLCSVAGGFLGGMSIIATRPKKLKRKSQFSLNKSKKY